MRKTESLGERGCVSAPRTQHQILWLVEGAFRGKIEEESSADLVSAELSGADYQSDPVQEIRHAWSGGNTNRLRGISPAFTPKPAQFFESGRPRRDGLEPDRLTPSRGRRVAGRFQPGEQERGHHPVDARRSEPYRHVGTRSRTPRPNTAASSASNRPRCRASSFPTCCRCAAGSWTSGLSSAACTTATLATPRATKSASLAIPQGRIPMKTSCPVAARSSRSNWAT
jgi:hypothetical protein